MADASLPLPVIGPSNIRAVSNLSVQHPLASEDMKKRPRTSEAVSNVQA
jgi:hypothetical protein